MQKFDLKTALITAAVIIGGKVIYDYNLIPRAYNAALDYANNRCKPVENLTDASYPADLPRGTAGGPNEQDLLLQRQVSEDGTTAAYVYGNASAETQTLYFAERGACGDLNVTSTATTTDIQLLGIVGKFYQDTAVILANNSDVCTIAKGEYQSTCPGDPNTIQLLSSTP